MSAEPVAAQVSLPFRLGSRTLATVRRRLVRISVPLEDSIAGAPITLAGLPARADGYYIRAVPATMVAQLDGASGMRAFVRQRYPRHYATLDLTFEDYLAGFAAKSRSGLRRKCRKLVERSGGALDIRLYRRPEQMHEFYVGARSVSALTYQEKLLDAGLPEGALDEMKELAGRDAVRAWLLFLDGRPISYLYAPARGDCLLYAFLGYDPAAADLSPGTVLQFEAMRMLTEERRFRWFDFTEGDGQHKRQFATGSVDSVDLVLLRPTIANRSAMAALDAFDACIASGKRVTTRLGLAAMVRAARR